MLRAVGLLLVLLLAAAVIGLAITILAIMVMHGIEGETNKGRGQGVLRGGITSFRAPEPGGD